MNAQIKEQKQETMLKIVETDKKLIDKTCMDLEEAVKRRKFGVLAVHNLKETLVKKGIPFDKECRIYEVCNPQQAKMSSIRISPSLRLCPAEFRFMKRVEK